VNDEQVIQAAVGYMEGSTSTASEVANHTPEESETQPAEEIKRAKRLRLMNKVPDPKETIYVGNLFYDVTAEDLRKQMEKYGIVEQVAITFDNRGISKG
jgi:RNA recognition motif-containing protein